MEIREVEKTIRGRAGQSFTGKVVVRFVEGEIIACDVGSPNAPMRALTRSEFAKRAVAPSGPAWRDYLGALRKLAWINGIIPVQRTFAGEIKRSLLPDFERRPELFDLKFDASELLAMEDDLLKRAERWAAMVQAGVARVDEAREAMGLDVVPADRIYLRPFSAIEVPAGEPPAMIESDDARAARKSVLQKPTEGDG